MGRRGLVLVTAATLALGYGLTRAPVFLAPAEPGASTPEGGKPAAGRNGEVWERSSASPKGHRAAHTEHLPLTGPSGGVDWPDLSIPVDIESDGLPIDLGKHLEVDDDWGGELAVTQEDPVNIGAELDVGDPLAWAQEAPSKPPIDIGAALDADEPGASDLAVAAEEPIEIGLYLDAEDPSGWEPDDTAGAPIEIGDFLDAGVSVH